MSLTHDAMLELMAYADGELDGADRARVEALVRTSDEARRVVDAMRGLGDVVRELESSGPASRGDADGIADDVMRAIERDAPAPQATRPRAAHVAKMASLEDYRERRGGALAWAAAALAVAATAIFWIQGTNPPAAQVADESPHEMPPVTQPEEPATPPAPAPAAVAQAENDEADLESVESSTHHVSVFYVPKKKSGGGLSAAASVVIWIDDHGGG
jgi:anti-sigma factor RsiW